MMATRKENQMQKHYIKRNLNKNSRFGQFEKIYNDRAIELTGII